MEMITPENVDNALAPNNNEEANHMRGPWDGKVFDMKTYCLMQRELSVFRSHDIMSRTKLTTKLSRIDMDGIFQKSSSIHECIYRTVGEEPLPSDRGLDYLIEATKDIQIARPEVTNVVVIGDQGKGKPTLFDALFGQHLAQSYSEGGRVIQFPIKYMYGGPGDQYVAYFSFAS
ncbi:hypothetical protein BS50DRAFT_584832 [Corynespora cassiicola Philippines]|uniref:Uncharacterized protein n=1 Tax=Corynespora cassiicola Philippines TaxID=1448308 RepID=A0A2T2P127_CORCC|nr:hypothetical protein BS50DRAFT_584832 [Corynespora cassiicola Philippines]